MFQIMAIKGIRNYPLECEVLTFDPLEYNKLFAAESARIWFEKVQGGTFSVRHESLADKNGYTLSVLNRGCD